jgi:hypothetical protein
MSVKLAPSPRLQFFTADGTTPANGGLLFTYLAGTSTKQPTYTTIVGDVANSNPIILNSDGRTPYGVWLTAGIDYKFIQSPSTDTDPPTSPIFTQDDISGINDSSVSASQWVSTGLTPTYISATQFTLVGDQTTDFHVGRRVKFLVTAGTVYGAITVSAYTTLTTITVALDSSGALDSGLSSVDLSMLTADNSAVPLAQTIHAATNKATPVGADEAGIWDSVSGLLNRISFTNIAAWISSSVNAATATAATTQNQNTNSTVIATTGYVDRANQISARQTVKFGPVDANGFSNFGGATGSTTVTATGTIYPIASYGMMDLIGSITNPSWTGLSTNGTMYLYLDIAANGTCTTGVGTLAPVYQWGGAYSTTNGQFTFNIQEMTGKVGDGATAAQTYRVYVGESTVAGGVTTAITWYALNGNYVSALYGLAISTMYVSDHKLGVTPLLCRTALVCQTTDAGYAVGDEIDNNGFNTSNNSSNGFTQAVRRNSVVVATGATGLSVISTSTFATTTLTPANWKLRSYVQRVW